jgi:hypothetical protein
LTADYWMDDEPTGGWKIFFDDTAFPDYLLIKATGMLDDAFYVSLFADLKAYMAATVGLHAQYIPLVFDARNCCPSRSGLNTLHRLIRREDCGASHIILWISQRGPNSPFQHSVALLLRALLRNVYIVSHLDEAFGLLGIPGPTPQPARSSLQARFARWIP